MYGARSDPKEVFPIRFRKSAVPFCDVRSNQECSEIQLVDEESIAARELLRVLADGVGEVDGLLIDEKLLLGECHLTTTPEKRVESGE